MGERKHGTYFNAATQIWECWWAGEFQWAITAQMWRLLKRERKGAFDGN